MNGGALKNVVEQRDLGIQVQSYQKEASQVDRVVKKAFHTLVFISHGTKCGRRDIMFQIYVMLQLVRPRLVLPTM